MKCIDILLNLIYPASLYCICCGNIIDETRTYNLCDHCIGHIKWCGEEVRQINGIKVLRCVEYGIYERTLIFSLKYNRKKYMARDIGKIMADRMSLTEIRYDIIMPVPMYKKKEKKRGFNQAALIAKHLSKKVGIPYISDALIRALDTKAMRGLNPAERESNVKNSFQINDKYATMLEGKTVLLIDDFFTTGSTAKEAFRIAKTAGIEDMYLLAFAAEY